MKLLIYIEKRNNKYWAGTIDTKYLTEDEKEQMIELARRSEAELKLMEDLMKDTLCNKAGIDLWQKFYQLIEEDEYKMKEPEVVEPESSWDKIKLFFNGIFD